MSGNVKNVVNLVICGNNVNRLREKKTLPKTNYDYSRTHTCAKTTVGPMKGNKTISNVSIGDEAGINIQ